MNKKAPDQAEINQKTMQMLLESGLSKHPAIGQLLSGAISTGNFNELYHYMDVNRKSINSFVQMTLIEANKSKENPFYPFPSGDEVQLLQGPIKIGIVNSYRGQDVWFGVQPSFLCRHTQIMGASGSGKTYLLSYFMEEAIRCSDSI